MKPLSAAAVTPDKGLVMSRCCISNHLLTGGMIYPAVRFLVLSPRILGFTSFTCSFSAEAILPSYQNIFSQTSSGTQNGLQSDYLTVYVSGSLKILIDVIITLTNKTKTT